MIWCFSLESRLGSYHWTTHLHWGAGCSQQRAFSDSACWGWVSSGEQRAPWHTASERRRGQREREREPDLQYDPRLPLTTYTPTYSRELQPVHDPSPSSCASPILSADSDRVSAGVCRRLDMPTDPNFSVAFTSGETQPDCSSGGHSATDFQWECRRSLSAHNGCGQNFPSSCCCIRRSCSQRLRR